MGFNPNTIQQLIAEYDVAETRRERREIENQILEATVWNDDDEGDLYFAHFTRDQYERITAEVETDDKELRALLRKPYVKLL